MADPDFTAQERRQAVAASLAEVDAPDAERIVREFLEKSAGSANDWDHRFLEFATSAGAGRLYRADAGDGVVVIFSPTSGQGLWLIDKPSLRGKGFLSAADVQRLASIVAEKRSSPA